MAVSLYPLREPFSSGSPDSRPARGLAGPPFACRFLCFFVLAGGVGGADKKWKGNFWFCFRRFIPPERTCIYILALWGYFVRPVLRHSRRCEALPVSAFCGNSVVRSHFVITSHRPFAFAHVACSALLHVRSVASVVSVVSICACPARPVRVQTPAVFRRNYMITYKFLGSEMGKSEFSHFSRSTSLIKRRRLLPYMCKRHSQGFCFKITFCSLIVLINRL